MGVFLALAVIFCLLAGKSKGKRTGGLSRRKRMRMQGTETIEGSY